MNSYTIIILFDPNAAMKWSLVDWFSLSKTCGKMYKSTNSMLPWSEALLIEFPYQRLVVG